MPGPIETALEEARRAKELCDQIAVICRKQPWIADAVAEELRALVGYGLGLDAGVPAPPVAEPPGPKADRPQPLPRAGRGQGCGRLTHAQVRAAAADLGPGFRMPVLADRLGVRPSTALNDLCRSAGLVMTGNKSSARWHLPEQPAG